MCSRKTKHYKKEKKAAEVKNQATEKRTAKKSGMFDKVMDFAFNRAPLRFSFKKMMIGLGYFMVGAIASFGLAPIYWLAGSFVAMLFFAYKVMHAESKKEAAKIGMWFGLGYFFAGLMWIMGVFFINPSTAAKVGIFAPFAVLGLAAYCALYFMFAALLSGYFTKGVQRAAAFAILFTLFEWARGLLFSGFPWNSVYLLLMPIPSALQSASLFGPYFITAILMASLSLFALGIGKQVTNPKRVIFVGGAILLMAVNFIYGEVRLRNHPLESENFRVRLVQGDVEQGKKWKREELDAQLKKYQDLSREKSADGRIPDLIIWPETAVVSPINLHPELRELVTEFLSPNQFLITGYPRVVNQEVMYNSLGLFTRSYYRNYDKQHLVPFGEYMPIAGMKKVTDGETDFSAGRGPETIEIKDGITFAPLICYEAIFTSDLIDRENRASFIVNVTNDAWFGRSAGPFQHFDNVRMRTIEEGLPMLRVANGGVNAVVDAYGRVVEVKYFEPSVIDVDLPAAAKKTLYSMTGNWLLIIILLLKLNLLIYLEKKKIIIG